MKERVLFICTHNSARSQMAEGLLRSLYGERYEVFSAGTKPSGVNPNSTEVMKEIGIDISNHYSKNVKDFINEDFDYVITVCSGARETCPFFPGGKKQIHKDFDDPSSFSGNKEEVLNKFREIRDKLKEWIEEFFNEKK
ncbi:arsenate reductase ArsC [candidate division WOR-3 bacterium]|nr:arsenate reductase ArsC [candidate division WOR-3 bacterium]